MIITKHDMATGRTASVSLHVTPGSLSEGRPPGTGPTTGKPRAWRWSQALAAIAPTTTISETGTFGANRRPSRMQATTKIDSPSSRGSSDGSPCRTCQSWTSVRREATLSPSMSPSIAVPT